MAKTEISGSDTCAGSGSAQVRIVKTPFLTRSPAMYLDPLSSIDSGFLYQIGLGLGPLLEVVILINSSIITTSLLATSVIFASFSLCTIFSDQRQMLYLGGTLFSLLSTLLLLSIANLFIGSTLLYQVRISYLQYFYCQCTLC